MTGRLMNSIARSILLRKALILGGRIMPILLVIVTCGCSPEPSFRLNSVHMLTIEKTMLSDGERVSDEFKNQLGNVMTAMFGTPNDPWFPDFIPDSDAASQVVSAELLDSAAGPVSSDREGQPRGLYREHCAQCHGISGDGAGPTAAFLNPYPRDFRLGKFKFKSTRLGHPPTNEDLRRVILNGIPGTSMPSFATLGEQEIDSLVNYVKYLSIRGQVERQLIENIPEFENQTLISGPTDEAAFQDQLALILEDVFLTVLDRWAKSKPTEVPNFPDLIFETQESLSILGRQLFYQRGNCAQCHGESGIGDGQTENFDDWTNEWLKRANVNPENRAEVSEFIDAGAFPPRKLRPRNLRNRIFRGGNRLDDIYRRIADGIEGTSMPANRLNLSANEIWALVAYMLDMPHLEQTDE